MINPYGLLFIGIVGFFVFLYFFLKKREPDKLKEIEKEIKDEANTIVDNLKSKFDK